MSLHAIATAVTWISRLTYEALHPSRREALDQAYRQAQQDALTFKRLLLAGDRLGIQLMLDGLVLGIKVDVTAGELQQLRGQALAGQLDAYDLLGLYCRARYAEFAQRAATLLQHSDSTGD